jgi:hypothetical protein
MKTNVNNSTEWYLQWKQMNPKQVSLLINITKLKRQNTLIIQ